MKRWLLLLGSNLGDDGRLRDALDLLAALGPVNPLLPISRLPPAGDGVGDYFNLLLELEHPDEALLQAQLRRIQQQLGREPGERVRVTIDIDLIARRHADGRWLVVPHAAAKAETWSGPIAGLIAERGIVLHRQPADASA